MDVNIDVIVITKREQFDDIFQVFKDDAKISENPNICAIGFDVEFISRANYPDSFSLADQWTYYNKENEIAVCKLQMSSPNYCIVIDLCELCQINNNYEGLPQNLTNIIKSESWIKMGVGVNNDILYMSNNYNLGQCSGGFDVKIFSHICGFPNNSLVELYNLIANKNIKKISVPHSDWSKTLTIKHIEYCFSDAYMSYIIGKKFLDMMRGIHINNINNINIISDAHSETKNSASSSSSLASHSNSSNNNIRQPCKEQLDKKHIIKIKMKEINYINRIQQQVQKKKDPLPIYKEHQSDISHLKYKISCNLYDKIAFGYGPNKSSAKMRAAENMHSLLYETKCE